MMVFPPLLKRHFILEIGFWFWLNLGTNSAQCFIYEYGYFNSLKLIPGPFKKYNPPQTRTATRASSCKGGKTCFWVGCLLCLAGTESWRSSRGKLTEQVKHLGCQGDVWGAEGPPEKHHLEAAKAGGWRGASEYTGDAASSHCLCPLIH